MNRLRAFVVALVLAAVASVGGQAPQPALKVFFFDVGQGDGALIQSPSGQNVLVDAGENATQMRASLASHGVNTVDLVIASHNHADHIGGIPQIVRELKPAYYMDNAVPATTEVQARVLQALAESGTQLLEPIGRRITLGDVTLTIVPPPGIPDWDQNDNSIGVLVEYGNFRMSFAGDAEPREWAWWRVNHPEWLVPVQVHKASHHGSIHGDTAAALSAFSPKHVIVSAGANNSYGHPDPEALRLYADAGASVYRTDLNGTVTVEASASGAYSINVERGDGAQPPPSTPAPIPTAFTLSGLVQDGSTLAALSGVIASP